MFCRRGRRGGGGRQGMGWGLDCLCWPWGRAFDWSYSPRGEDIWIFLRPTWRYLTTYVRVNLIFKPLLAPGTRMEFNCQRSSRAKKRGCLGGRFIMPRNVGKNSQIRHNPLKFAFLTIFGREQTTIRINLWRKKTSWRVFWRTSNSNPLYPRNCCRKNWAWKCIRVVRWPACTSQLASIVSVPFVLTPKKISVYGCSCS